MKSFIFKLFVFFLLLLIPIFLVFVQANGYSYPFYLRFTTPKQSSLILGTSKAAQGIRPDIINGILARDDIYNYSFTVVHSPYGQTYLKSIKKKLSKTNKNGIFIVTVDPWSLSSNKKDVNNPDIFVELNNCLSNTTWVNTKPNIEYLLKNYNKPYVDLLRKSEIKLHNNGWLEVTVLMDSISVNRRLLDKLTLYKEGQMTHSGFSKVRLEYLIKTIKYLKQYGKVYLIRLPVHPQIMKIENEYMTDFDSKIKSVVLETANYFDMTHLNDNYKYTDGMHLDKKSAKEVSKIIAEWIQSEDN